MSDFKQLRQLSEKDPTGLVGVKFELGDVDGGGVVLIPGMVASVLMGVYSGLNPKNQQRFREMSTLNLLHVYDRLVTKSKLKWRIVSRKIRQTGMITEANSP